MMKKILIILLLIACKTFLFGQNVVPRSGPSLTTSDSRFQAALNMFVPRYADTTAAMAGTNEGIDSCGAIIFTYNVNGYWYRACSPKRWVRIGIPTSITFTTDSTVTICFGENICISIGVNLNQFFQTINNAFGGCNNLLRGGIVTAANPIVNLIFDVTAADYTIGCKSYHTDLSQVTLANGDATFGRFDVVIVDTNEVVSVVQGTPSADPQVPQINPASQLALTQFLVPAGATTASQLGITQTVIYDQNLGTPTEWNGAATSWTSDRDNLSFPFHLTKCDLVSGSTGSTSQISWTTTDTMRNGQFDVFKFYIRLTDAWNSAQGLDISFYHGTTKVTNSVIMMNNSYGFDISTTGAYQTIAIPMANWVFSDSIFFKVVIKPLAQGFSSQAFRLDWIQLQGGINQALGGSSGLYIWNQNSIHQPANFDIAGDGTVAMQLSSPNLLYSGSEKFGLQSRVTAVQGTALGSYSYVGGFGGLAIGSQSSAPNGGLAIGYFASVGAGSDLSIGGAVTGFANTLVGLNGSISGNTSMGMGQNVTVTHTNAAVFGYFGASSRNNEFKLGNEYNSIEARGITRGIAGYVLTDSLGDGSYWVPRPAGGTSLLFARTDASNATGAGAFFDNMNQDFEIANVVTMELNATSFSVTSNVNSLTRIQSNTTSTDLLSPSNSSYITVANNDIDVEADNDIILSVFGSLLLQGLGTGSSTDDILVQRSSVSSQAVATIPASTFQLAMTASDGIHLAGADIRLGGTLSKDTTIVLGANTLLFTANTLSGDPAISVTSTSTAAASNLQKGINIDLSGANSNSTQSTFGVYSTNSHTGTSSTNYGGYFTSSGANTNYGVYGNGTTYGVYGNGSTYGVYGNASTYGVYGNGSAAGVVGVGGTGATGVVGQATEAGAISGSSVYASTNDVVSLMALTRTTTGTTANGLGGSFDFNLQDADGNTDLSNQFISKLTTAANATRTSQLILTGVTSATTQNWLTLSSGGALRLDQYGAGTLTTDGSGNVTATSDKRVKHDIRPMKYGLSSIMQLQPSTFIYNNDGSNTIMPGFVAQNVKDAFGGIGVGKDKQGYLTLNTNVIIAGLVNGMQEQQKQIELLKAKIEKLEKR